MTRRGIIHCVAGLSLVGASIAGAQQSPKGAEGLSFRSETLFEAADDFVSATGDPITALRWWGSFADEPAPGGHTTGDFRIRFYTSLGGLPRASLASYTVRAAETWTGAFCRGVEGLGGSLVCPGPEPLYEYEAALDPPFEPQPGTEYWLGVRHELNNESRFWAWHEADGIHPIANEAATWSTFNGWRRGMINACPGDFSSTVGPYDLAFELRHGASCPADLNGDGVIDLADLGILLADFGCVAPGPCPGDIDNDGDTDLADLGILLAEFGNRCP